MNLHVFLPWQAVMHLQKTTKMFLNFTLSVYKLSQLFSPSVCVCAREHTCVVYGHVGGCYCLFAHVEARG